ncbi:ArsR/SmtB family transcription factor [Duganella violaceipulchra]|uniref:DNA-binding transcriptional ArsR family regulator n=1 Tax=Duganella violaceipulchra TaxID=2849652 RepID=A0AA41L1C4_9BURK|nr:metalloregulator ArsR/SmtB family transcription factor [Duganella violaceicalia]MBV6324566.1 metalloregulator ArsR/SmtB family transcription factor [Duganella violaceicalia]MCP2009273.1 DNA-binding transcriptional ArsR family regulator [Duganella violaceicalia]
MVNYKDPQLDLVFAALSDATRRGVLAQLGDGSCTVTELAQQYEMSLPGFMKHLAVLETAGLIARSKEGRVVRCELHAAPMQEAAVWIAHYQRFWTEQLDALGRYLYHQEEIASCQPPNSPPKSVSDVSTPSAPKKSGAPGPTRKR